MIAMKKDLIASLADIEAIIVECSNLACNAQVKVPVRADMKQHDIRLIPMTQCPVCLRPFDSTLSGYVKTFIGSLTAHQGQEKISILLNSEVE